MTTQKTQEVTLGNTQKTLIRPLTSTLMTQMILTTTQEMTKMTLATTQMTQEMTRMTLARKPSKKTTTQMKIRNNPDNCSNSMQRKLFCFTCTARQCDYNGYIIMDDHRTRLTIQSLVYHIVVGLNGDCFNRRNRPCGGISMRGSSQSKG